MSNLHRFIIIGCGNVGDVHAKVVSEIENARLAAIVDKDEENGRKFASKYGCGYYSSYQEAIEKEDFTIASICTPSFSHCDIAIDLVNAGKHVIIEKPIDISLESSVVLPVLPALPPPPPELPPEPPL